MKTIESFNHLLGQESYGGQSPLFFLIHKQLLKIFVKLLHDDVRVLGEVAVGINFGKVLIVHELNQ